MATPLFLMLPLFLAFSSLTAAFPIRRDANDAVVDDDYTLDFPVSGGSRRGRFLMPAATLKKGAQCDVNSTNTNICDGVSANNGTCIFHCCKHHCRNTLGDRDNCGKCGTRCHFGEMCCGGFCTNVGTNASHCGKCNSVCLRRCDRGMCDYA